MDGLRKYAALLTLAESSEAGRLTALKVIIEAAIRAQADADQSLPDIRPEELLCVLSCPDKWVDGSPWMDAFEYHLAEFAFPGLAHHIGCN